MANGGSSGTGKTVVIVLVVAALAAIPILGVLATLAIYGVRKYIASAKMAEGRTEVAQLTRGIVACGNGAGALPASSHAVPASLKSVSGMKYMSAPVEWSGDPAFACAHFSMSSPQYFQYRWERDTPESGHVIALADFDGDGSPEHEVRFGVACAAGSCRPTTLDER